MTGAPRARRAAIAAVVAAGVLAGCGDEGPSREEFAREANAVCKRHYDKITAEASKLLAGGRLPNPREFGRLAQQTIIPEYSAQIRELRDVEPPEDLADDYDAWLQESQALRAMLARNPALIQQPRNLAGVNARAERLGLGQECRVGPG